MISYHGNYHATNRLTRSISGKALVSSRGNGVPQLCRCRGAVSGFIPPDWLYCG